MSLSPERIRQNLQDFAFTPLFVDELGWEKPRPTRVEVAGGKAREVAHLGNIPAFEITLSDVPDLAERRKIHANIAKLHHENLLIFTDEKRSKALWYWVKREGGKSVAREHSFFRGQPGDLFLAKLAGLFVDIEEYDENGAFSVLRAGQKLKNALDVSRTSKKFYVEYEAVRENIAKHVHGVPGGPDKARYITVLLNRLMFIYFLQKKGFLGQGNERFDYLQLRLAKHRSPKSGSDKDGFFQEFLQHLFFDGFATPVGERSADTKLLLGLIPYLNGGFFLPHPLERKHDISVDDAAFDIIFGLFGDYSWYLNDKPPAKDGTVKPDSELDPEVLGHIFERYINDQKSAGAYYTREEITSYLCERTVHDLLVERVTYFRDGKPTKYESLGDLLLHLDGDLCRVVLEELKGLRLCDPAVGSGAFLVAALKTLTDIYGALWGRAEVLNDQNLKLAIIGDSKYHHAPFYAIRKRIITENLYGVDLMEGAPDIARLRLFLALVAGAKTADDLEPLPNIEFNILEGNSLMGLLRCEAENFVIGSSPDLLLKTDFDELSRDFKNRVRVYKANEALSNQQRLELKGAAEGKADAMTELCNRALLSEFDSFKIRVAPSKRAVTVADLQTLRPFHWGANFAEVMEAGGFDAIITNPPWEIWKPNDKEFFAPYSPLITKKTMTIKDFQTERERLLRDPKIAVAYDAYLAQFPHVSEYFRRSPSYANQISLVNGKKAGTDINLYKLFLERCFALLKSNGRCGIVIPSGIYTDLGAKQLREMLFEQGRITSLFGIANEKFIFEGVDHRFKFSILSFAKGGKTTIFPAAFRITPGEAVTAEGLGGLFRNRNQQVELDAEVVRRLSPDSLGVMEFKSGKDLEVAEKLLNFTPLGERMSGSWNLSLTAEFHMTSDSHLFHSEPKKGSVPLYEGKMMHQFNPRHEKPRYWVNEKAARLAVLGRKGEDKGQILDYQRPRLALRAIARSSDQRTIIVSPIPPYVFCGNSLLVNKGYGHDELNECSILYLQGVLNSFVVDYYIRLMVSANINMFYVYRIPVPRLTQADAAFQPIVTRAAKLICTTPEFDELARAAGIGTSANGAADEGQRATLRAELDALVARLYGLDEGEFEHILSTFPLVSEPVKLAARNKFRDLERGVFIP